MKVALISIFVCVLSGIIWVENAGSVPENVMDDASTEYIDATSSTVSESLFTIPDIQKLPSDTHLAFTDMRLNGYIYVDKTAFIKKLLELPSAGQKPFVIVSRPRRFGKTIFLQMLEQFFLGNKLFFNNTVIAEQMPGEWTKYPVIYIDFNSADDIFTVNDITEFQFDFKNKLYSIGKKYGLDRESSYKIDILIENLQLKTGLPVVILIDEYDKVIKKASDADKSVFRKFKKVVGTIYDKIKSQSRNVKLLFITGISRLSLSYFESGLALTNIRDLTFSKDFSSVMGFTLDEIRSYYGPSLQRLAIKNAADYSSIIEKITKWYDGYRFSLEDHTKIFNPISIISCLIEEKIKNYWVKTGNIILPIERMRESNKDFSEFLYYDITSDELTTLYDDERNSSVPLAVLLHNYGYLTILRYNEKSDTVFLGYPNKEIEGVILNKLAQSQSDTIYYPAIRKCLQQEDMKNLVKYLNNAVFYYEYKVPNLQMNEAHATKYILNALQNTNFSVDYSGTVIYACDNQAKGDHQTTGDLDIVLTSPGFISITISVKYRISAVKAINQLIDYSIHNPTELRRSIGKFSKNDDPAHTQLIGINVDHKKGELPAVKDWIILPYRDGKIFMDESLANNVTVLVNLKNSLIQKANNWNQVTCARAYEVLVWKNRVSLLTDDNSAL